MSRQFTQDQKQSALETGAVKPLQGRTAFVKQLAQCVLVAWLAFASYQLASHYILQSVEVVGCSMSPTMEPADRYLLNRLVFFWRDPMPSEIVVLRDPAVGDYVVKRVIACAGDTVYIGGGHVYVNGRQLKEPYLPDGTFTYTLPDIKELTVRCGDNEYFVLGDNRRESADSRVYGPVARQNILGVIIH